MDVFRYTVEQPPLRDPVKFSDWIRLERDEIRTTHGVMPGLVPGIHVLLAIPH